MELQLSQIKGQIASLARLLRNYIDGHVITAKVAKQFVSQPGNTKTGTHGDFSLNEVLEFLRDHSAKRDIQKSEERLFMMAGMINSFLIERHFALKENRQTRLIYMGAGGQGLESVTKNVIGLSNFVASFGGILRQRTVKGKPDGSIKRVMDTEANEMRDSDADFDLYKLPVTKVEQDKIVEKVRLENVNAAKMNAGQGKSNDPVDLENELTHDPAIKKAELSARHKEIAELASQQHRVRLVGGETSLNSDPENLEEVDQVLSASELQKKRQKTIERDQKRFREHDTTLNHSKDQDSDLLLHETSHLRSAITDQLINEAESINTRHSIDQELEGSQVKSSMNGSSPSDINLASETDSLPLRDDNQDILHAQTGAFETVMNESAVSHTQSGKVLTNQSQQLSHDHLQISGQNLDTEISHHSDNNILHSNSDNSHINLSPNSQELGSTRQELINLSANSQELHSDQYDPTSNPLKQNSQSLSQSSQSNIQLDLGENRSSLSNFNHSENPSETEADLRSVKQHKLSLNNEELDELKMNISSRSGENNSNYDMEASNTSNDHSQYKSAINTSNMSQNLQNQSVHEDDHSESGNRSTASMTDDFEREEQRFKDLASKGYPLVEKVDDDLLSSQKGHPNELLQHQQLGLTDALRRFDTSPESGDTYKTLNQLTSVPFQEMKEGILNNKDFQKANQVTGKQSSGLEGQDLGAKGNFAETVRLEQGDHPEDRQLTLKDYLTEKHHHNRYGSIYNTRHTFLPSSGEGVKASKNFNRGIKSRKHAAGSNLHQNGANRAVRGLFEPVQYAKHNGSYMPNQILRGAQRNMPLNKTGEHLKKRSSSAQNVMSQKFMRGGSDTRKKGFSVYGKKKWANMGRIPLV